MHPNCMNEAAEFAERFAPKHPALKIADIGSMDVNGTMRPAFAGHEYVGFDIAPGKGVDVVLANPEVIEAESGSFDVVISANAIEHMRRPWLVVKEMARILKPGGAMFIMAPCRHAYHPYPIDCWRIYAEGMRGLLENAGMKVIEVRDDSHEEARRPCGDTVGIAVKP